jgi:hypothetical protein
MLPEHLRPSLVQMCGINAFGIAEIAKGLFRCAKQSKKIVRDGSQGSGFCRSYNEGRAAF